MATRALTPEDGSACSPTRLLASVCAIGVSAVLTQVTLMRELLAAFSGNELVFGIVLGNWMLLTGIGSAVGRTASRLRSPMAALVVAQVLVALLPVADVFLLRTLRNVVFLRGTEVGATDTMVTCFVLLAPYCLLIGYLLPLASLVAGQAFVRQAFQPDPTANVRLESLTYAIGRVYFLDNVGSVLGGAAFSLLLVHIVGHFGILYAAAAVNLVLAGLLARSAGRRALLGAVALAGAALAGIALVDLDRLSIDLQFRGQQVVEHRQSPYGSLVVTKLGRQYNFIENGVVLFSTDNTDQVEETVHYAMAQRTDARRVLLIAGGVSGTAKEILKYPVEAVDYVELDPAVIETARRWLPHALDEPRIHVMPTDGRLFIKQTAARYDVVLLDVPAPSTSQLNRFFTREFFAEVQRVLQPDGVVSFAFPGFESHPGPELASMYATAHRTLKEVFGNVLVLPGARTFFLASEGHLTNAIGQRLQAAGIATRLLTPAYLDDLRSPGRQTEVHNTLSDAAPINRDFSPILYYQHLCWWMNQFKTRFGLLEAALLGLLALYVVRLRPVALAVFTTGFAASALEVVLLLGFQVLYGSVYHQVGMVVTMFMLGLGIGAWAVNRRVRGGGGGGGEKGRKGEGERARRDSARHRLAWILLGLAAFSACLPAALMGLGRLDGGLAAHSAQVAVPLLTLALGILVGLAFPLAASLAVGQVSNLPGVEGVSKSPQAGPVSNLPEQDPRVVSPTLGKLKTCPTTIAGTASRLYLADYMGAALGALLVSTLLIPLVGVVNVCLLTASLAVLSALMLQLKSK
jgi:spermidine synthase